jgi:hypothetical protein
MRLRQKRMLPRLDYRIPVKLIPHGTFEGLKEDCLSVNVSSNAICFMTYIPLAVGDEIEIVFTMPQELTRRLNIPYIYTGKVVRTDRVKGPQDKYKVTARLLWMADIGPRKAVPSPHKNRGQSAA